MVIVVGDAGHGHMVATLLEGSGIETVVVESVEEAERLTAGAVLYDTDRGVNVRGFDPAVAQRRRELVDVIARRAFRVVFQPMVALYKSEVVGYEALTRFDDGTPPVHRFGDATMLGLGTELELVTVAAAVAAARALPADRFVSINVSPDLLIDHQEELEVALGDLHHDRSVVLEITEHDVVHDYASLRSGVDRFEPKVKLSVDDAGAGFSTLRHVVMLEPEYVKLDRSWVSDIHVDPTRQALVAGLSHFARTTGCELVAEGIESEEERETLTSLDVSLGQGYLLGPPA